MASISTDSAGNRTIQFVGIDRKRRSLRLGRVSMKAAEKFRDRVEDLNSARLFHSAPPEYVASWAKKIGDNLHAKLAAVGLVEPREGTRTTLGAFLRDYIDRRTDVKPNTRRHLQQSQKYLIDTFGDALPLRSITRADADGFAARMRSEGNRKTGGKGKYAETTVARVIKHARQFFTAAVGGNLVEFNPFAK